MRHRPAVGIAELGSQLWGGSLGTSWGGGQVAVTSGLLVGRLRADSPSLEDTVETPRHRVNPRNTGELLPPRSSFPWT